MGGGAPLAFLNKKTWHPGRMQNLEEVWKREQAAAAEQRKLEELKKQYEEERKNAEFTQMAEEAGYKKDNRLDWMYAGSLAAKHAAAAATAAGGTAAATGQQQEQPLMGKAPAPDENLSRAERAMQLPSFLAADTPASQNEAWARLNNDPLLAIKKQEQDALKQVKQNPIKMQQILKEVEKVRKHKKEKKEKKEKKDKKHKKHNRHSSSSPENHNRHPVAAAVGQRLKRGRSRSRSASPIRQPHAPKTQSDRPSDRYEERGGRDRYHEAEISHHRAAASRNGMSRGRNGEHYSLQHQGRRQHSSSGAHAARHHRSRSRSNSRDGGVDRPERHQQRDKANMQRVDSNHHKRDDRHAGIAERSGNDHAAGHHGHKADREEQDVNHRHRDRADHHHHHHNNNEQQMRSSDGRYGLELATSRHTTRGIDMQHLEATAEARAAATRQRLAEAEAAQEAAQAAAAAAQRERQRKEYKPGKLTAEEKSAKLAEMMGNAQQHEQQRAERLQQARASEAAERGVAGLLAKAAASQAEDAFKSAAAAEVFGSLAGGGMSLDARISSRRHYHER